MSNYGEAHGWCKTKRQNTRQKLLVPNYK
jgi:hypothetical protein